jgi:hypothetical protein
LQFKAGQSNLVALPSPPIHHHNQMAMMWAMAMATRWQVKKGVMARVATAMVMATRLVGE